MTMMMNSATGARHRMWLEEWYNVLSHGVGAIASLIGFVFLVIYGMASPKDWALMSAIFFGLSLIAVYFSSTIYHSVLGDMQLKRKLGIIDHSCIFLLIAGTHTPILLLAVGGAEGWYYFWLEWIVTAIGILIKIFYKDEFDKYSVWLYLVMSFVGALHTTAIETNIGTAGLNLIKLGGVSYIVGLVFFIIDKKVPFAHFIWHLFVIGGSVLHYFAIILYILV